MKAIKLSVLFSLLLLFAFQGTIEAQVLRNLQYFRAQDQTGVNVFESPKVAGEEFDGVRVKIGGGANTLQFQALDHINNNDDIFDLHPNFNLATSNLDLDVQLDRGVRMHLRTYLSSRHHAQPYVKGGYLQIDRLDFITPGFMDNIMDFVTIKFGHMEINYGDNHFRRSDNGATIFNPFVGNYIMDSFTTEVGGEVYFRKDGLMVMLGMTNGKLNQSVVEPGPGQYKTHASLVGKLGFDRQLNEDLRVRVTGSVYHTGRSNRTYLYAGDRAGARYYNIMTDNSSEFRVPRIDPGFNNKLTAIMINPFVKFRGFEFYGVFENASGKAQAETDTRTFNQYGAELLYRFGGNERFYVGSRYNLVAGTLASQEEIDVSRVNFGGGWFMTKNILTKVEYVTQAWNGYNPGSRFDGAEFKGMMIEAVISF